MHLSWLGLAAFKIETPQAVIVTDPFSPGLGPRPVRAKADLVTVSDPTNPAHNHTAGISGTPFVITHPGEFEVKGVYVQGRTLASPTVFTFDVGGFRLAHCGGLRTVPPAETLELLGEVHVLFVPVGGGTVLEPADALKIVSAVEPRAVVPMFFAQKGVTLGGKQGLLPVTSFLREMGASGVEATERLSLKQKDLPEEETKVLLFRTGE